MDYRAGPGSGSSQMWIPLECAFSLIVHPLKGPCPLLFVRPCCTPASVLRPSSFPTACTGTATAGTRASLVGGRTLLQPGGGDWGAGGLSPSPPFFLGPGTGGQRGETLGNSLEVKEFGFAVQAPLIPGPSWECHYNLPSPTDGKNSSSLGQANSSGAPK